MTQETRSTAGGTAGSTNKAAMLRVLWAQGETAAADRRMRSAG